MTVFPSASSNGLLPRQTDLLNATEQKPASHAVFGVVEEELRDANRVVMHGEEDDLRYVLGMVITRIEESASLHLSRLIPVSIFFMNHLWLFVIFFSCLLPLAMMNPT